MTEAQQSCFNDTITYRDISNVEGRKTTTNDLIVLHRAEKCLQAKRVSKSWLEKAAGRLCSTSNSLIIYFNQTDCIPSRSSGSVYASTTDSVSDDELQREMRQNLFRNIDLYSNNKAFVLARVTRKAGSIALPGRADKLRIFCLTIDTLAPDQTTLHYVSQNQQTLVSSLRKSWKIRSITEVDARNKSMALSFKVGSDQQEQWVAQSELAQQQVLWCLVHFRQPSCNILGVDLNEVRHITSDCMKLHQTTRSKPPQASTYSICIDISTGTGTGTACCSAKQQLRAIHNTAS
jgi:hypothetical protein